MLTLGFLCTNGTRFRLAPIGNWTATTVRCREWVEGGRVVTVRTADGRGSFLEESGDGAASPAAENDGSAGGRAESACGTTRAQVPHAGASRLPRSHGVHRQLRVWRWRESYGWTGEGMHRNIVATFFSAMQMNCFAMLMSITVLQIIEMSFAGELQILGKRWSGGDRAWQMYQQFSRCSCSQGSHGGVHHRALPLQEQQISVIATSLHGEKCWLAETKTKTSLSLLSLSKKESLLSFVGLSRNVLSGAEEDVGGSSVTHSGNVVCLEGLQLRLHHKKSPWCTAWYQQTRYTTNFLSCHCRRNLLLRSCQLGGGLENRAKIAISVVTGTSLGTDRGSKRGNPKGRRKSLVFLTDVIRAPLCSWKQKCGEQSHKKMQILKSFLACCSTLYRWPTIMDSDNWSINGKAGGKQTKRSYSNLKPPFISRAANE